jgi:Na+-translocating ferredoxin:NAD+ oxidoreductase RnfG subunit
VIALAITCAAPALQAKVFASQHQALREAFPEATRIDRHSRILLNNDLAEIIGITKSEDQPKLVVLYTAWNGDELLGHAHVDVHNVRTKPEAFLIVVTPGGAVRSVRVLAFHEPLDYLPTDRWYGQFSGKTKADRLRVGGDVHGVVGATLSAQAAARGVRRMLAYWEVLLQKPDSTESAKYSVVPMLPKSLGTAEPELQEP